MPIDQDELKGAARSLRLFLFGQGQSDLGFVGIGASDIQVFVHAGRRAWMGDKHVMTWEGFSVIWHYKVGPMVANLDVA